MRRMLLALTITAVLYGSGPTGLVGQAHSEPARERVAHRLAEELWRQAHLPGFAIAVGRDGTRAWAGAFGYADLEQRAPVTLLTRWRIGSISKSLTAAGAVLLARKGKLDLDRPVASSLSGWDDRPAGPATARQLAGHLAGIRHYRKDEGIGTRYYGDVMEALELFASDSLVAEPGTRYDYSTYGYVLLSALMQRAAGVPYLEWMTDHLFDRLEMPDTGPDLAMSIVPDRAAFYEIRDGRLRPAPFTDNSYKWAGGGFLSTPTDLVRFGNGLLEGALVDSTGLALLFDSQQTAEGETTGYGMGFRPDIDDDGRRVVHHGGSSEGARAFLMLYPDDRIVVAMAANRATAPLFEEEAAAFAHLFLDHGESGDGEFDGSLAGAWRASGSLGEGSVQGSLHLYGEGEKRGMFEWGRSHAPIHIVAVDRHGESLRLIGVGRHGVMRASLDPAEGSWEGSWSYLGRDGSLRLAAREPVSGSGSPTSPDSGRSR